MRERERERENERERGRDLINTLSCLVMFAVSMLQVESLTRPAGGVMISWCGFSPCGVVWPVWCASP